MSQARSLGANQGAYQPTIQGLGSLGWVPGAPSPVGGVPKKDKNSKEKVKKSEVDNIAVSINRESLFFNRNLAFPYSSIKAFTNFGCFYI